MLKFLWGILLPVSLFLAGPAQAATAITNLDDKPHTVLIEEAGSEKRSVTIEPGRTERLTGAGMVIYYEDQFPIRVHGYEGMELAIWPPGRISVQRYHPRASGHGN